MSATVYECMFILDANRYARDAGGVVGALNAMVEKVGGEILASRLWADQKLAYPIKGHKKGVYWLMFIRCDGPKIKELTRACQLNESVLRQLMLKVDPRLADTLVDHARGVVREAPPAEASPAAEQPEEVAAGAEG